MGAGAEGRGGGEQTCACGGGRTVAPQADDGSKHNLREAFAAAPQI